MEALELTVPTEKHAAGRWRLYPIGDVHVDLKTCDRKRLRRYLELIAEDPHGVYLFVGDAVDGTTPNHKWYEPSWIRDEFVLDMEHYGQLCLDACEEIFSPLKDTPGVVLRGNHDFRKDMRFFGFSKRFADLIGAKYGHDMCMVRVRAETPAKSRGAVAWSIWAHHGAGAGFRPGGKVNRAQLLMLNSDADIIVRGHVHDADIRITHVDSITARGNPTVTKKPRAVVTASSFANETGYAERKGYAPNDMGIMWLEITNPSQGSGPRDGGRMRRIESDF